MKTLVIYTSQTGFTQKYAEWLTARLNADLLTIKEAKNLKKDSYDKYDAIIYGGWNRAGSVVGSEWFLKEAFDWKNKRLAIFCVGGFPENNPDVEISMNKLLTDEQKTYIRAFYCQGGIDYSRMKTPSKLVMKTLISALSKKKDATQEEKDMVDMLSHSHDNTDEKYIIPIVQYIEEGL